MILVDSSVWIDHLRDTATEQVSHLRSLMPGEELLVGDLVLCEVLQGLRSDAEARLVERRCANLKSCLWLIRNWLSRPPANYRFLRSLGFTVRRTIDLLVATFCIERGHSLLHSDRDYTPMQRFLGLQTI